MPQHLPPTADSWRSGFAGARLVELDAAHLTNIEAAPAFNAALASFLT